MKLFNKKRKKISFVGDFKTWDEAKQKAGGYDQYNILAKTEEAMREIIAGKAVFERDTILMLKPEYPWPLISFLLSVAAASGGNLSVLDFGGALGSSFFQCRKFLRAIPKVSWSIVEQKHVVESGIKNFSTQTLTFSFNAKEACAMYNPNILILSSVLPYLEEPYKIFSDLLKLSISYVVVDRTFFLKRPGERLTVQKVPEWIYPASYPAWFLDESKLCKIAEENGYHLEAEFNALDDHQPDGEKAYAKGLFWSWQKVYS